MLRHLLTVSAIGLAAYFALTPSTPHLSLAAIQNAPTGLIETEAVQAPYAYRRLCAQEPQICAAERAAETLAPLETAMADRFGDAALQPAPIEMTDQRRTQLERVNAIVNTTIEPREDLDGDQWSIGALVGDCEEYVLAKREMLLRLGWPRSALRITVVHDGVGYHAVLVVATDAGEFVLDNLVGYISHVESSPYQFIVAESLTQPGAWVRVSRARP